MKTIKQLVTLLSISTALLSQSAFASSDVNETGEKLFKTYCSACHGATGGMDMSKRIAPPIAGVRKHYISTYPDKDSFVMAVTSWIEKQDESQSLMPGAIQKFKIMPPISVPKKDAETIAAYIYAGNIEKPEGFDEHVAQMHGKKRMNRQTKQQGIQKQGQRRMQSQGQRGMQNKSIQRRGQGKGSNMKYQMIRQLNLSPEQQQKIQALIKQKEATLQPLKQQKQEISNQIHKLDALNPNYKSEIFELADKKAKLVYRMVIEKGEMRMKVESLLTPEQRYKFNQLRAQKREMNQGMR